MAENRALSGVDLHHVKEAICVDTNRVYDSCADKDCLADLRVYLTDCAQNVIEGATSVRARSAEILNCVIGRHCKLSVIIKNAVFKISSLQAYRKITGL